MRPLDTSDYRMMLDNARRMVQQARTPADLERARRSVTFWSGMVASLWNRPMSTTCTYVVPTRDEAVDRECGKHAVASVTPGRITIYLCRQHERKVRRHGLAEVQPLA